MFSRTERIILANQYRILALLDPSQRADYETVATAFEKGYEPECETYTQHVSEEMLPADTCSTVRTIIHLFDCIINSYLKLDDKSGIDDSHVVFRGFDGNTEARLCGYAAFVLNEYEEESNLRKRSRTNSHAPEMPAYRRMLKEWKNRGSKQNLSKEDIKVILDFYNFTWQVSPGSHQADQQQGDASDGNQ